MQARAALRNATAEDHERVDALFSRFDLTQPEGYRAFLRAQVAATRAVEAALDEGRISETVADWPQRRRAALAVADLAALGAQPPYPLPKPALFGTAQLLGAAYVLEGSRLGAKVLRRGLPPEMPQTFLSAPAAPGAWAAMLMTIEAHVVTREDVAMACGAARRVFALFEAAATRELEYASA